MTLITVLKLAVAILSIGGALFGWFRVRRIIRDRVRIKELENANKGWVEADELIGRAQDARRGASGVNADRVSTRKYRRPKG